MERVRALQAAAVEARLSEKALAEALQEAEEPQAGRVTALGHLAMAEGALQATQEALSEVSPAPDDDLLREVGELLMRCGRVVGAWAKAEQWSGAEGDLRQELRQMKHLAGEIRKRLEAEAARQETRGCLCR